METEPFTEPFRTYNPNVIGLTTKDRNSYYATKRFFDFILALSLLILLSPLMLLTAALIFVYSPGPIFFIQERVGSKRQQHGKQTYWIKKNFNCYKFRTMHPNVNTAIHQAYIKALIENNEQQMAALQGGKAESTRKLVNDSRIIRPGHILRKLSIDELPQLWNVVRGEMSLVGPRPAIPYEVDMYKSWHLMRLEAQPGITGLQQVKARCNTEFDNQVKWDIEYVTKQSIWLDFKIICLTPMAVISTRGAH